MPAPYLSMQSGDDTHASLIAGADELKSAIDDDD